jgi:hypothetical protein
VVLVSSYHNFLFFNMVVSFALEQPLVFIPELLDVWPLPKAVSPSYEVVKAESSNWFRQYKLFSSEKRFLKQEFSDLGEPHALYHCFKQVSLTNSPL